MILNDEQRQIRDLARDFAQGELRPHTARWDEEGRFDEGVRAKLAEVGFLGMLAPESLGGLGLDVPTYLMVLEELAWGDAAVALTVAIHCGPVTGLILAHGTPEIQERWVPALASGQVLGAFALSEPEVGSDAAAVETRARRNGVGWVLSGRKKWITNGGLADVVLVFARTGADRDMGCFLVEPTQEGYEVVARANTMGLRASETAELELEGVRVPSGALVGKENEGLRYALQALDLGRLGIAAQALGIARASMEHATAYAVERQQFGRAIGEFGAIQKKLAEMATRIAAARELTLAVGMEWQRAGFGGRGGEGVDTVSARAAMAKMMASEAAMWASDEAVQIFGGYGYMRDYPVEKLMRDAKGTEISEGTNEIMRMVVAREMLRVARNGKE